MRISLRSTLFAICGFALLLQLYTVNSKVRRLETEKKILERQNVDLSLKLLELMPLSYNSFSCQFILQVEKQLGSKVEIDKLRYIPKEDEYIVQFASFEKGTGLRWMTSVPFRRTSLTEYSATIVSEFPLTEGKDIPVSIKLGE